MPRSHSRRNRALVLLLALSLSGCQAIRLYAKDLLDPRASAGVSIPVRVTIGLFVVPPTIAWLPISILPLLLVQNEGSVWFALAPGMIVGGPFVLLAGTPGYLVTDRPESETRTRRTAPEAEAAVTSQETPSSGDGHAPLTSSTPSGR